MNLLDLDKVNELLSGYQDCLVGVSGGIDSMVLVHWLCNNRSDLVSDFRVMHVDHGIHPDSAVWAHHVQSTCGKLGVPCEVRKVSLDGLGNNLEYAARQARYGAFCQSGAGAIILAHHANDQCESFFLKLFRGSGVRGLKAMNAKAPCWFDENVSVLRPMLAVTRDQIESYATEHSIYGIEDPSNADNRYDRNYIRNELWPVVKRRFDIADINTLRSIQHLSEAWELTVVLADADIASCQLADGVLDWARMRDLGYLRIKNMILRILDLENVYGFSINHVEQFAQGLLSADMDARNELALKGFTMNKIGKKIHVGRNQRKVA